MAGAVEIMTRRRGGTKRRVSRARTDQIAKQSDRVTRVLYQEFRIGRGSTYFCRAVSFAAPALKRRIARLRR